MASGKSVGGKEIYLVFSIIFISIAFISVYQYLPREIVITGNQIAPVTPNPSHLVALAVKETEGVERISWPVLGGIPLPRGQVTSLNQLRILRLSGGQYYIVPSQFVSMTQWPDGSYKWVQYYFSENSLPANSQNTYYLSYDQQVLPEAQPSEPLSLQDLPAEIVITTGNREFVIDKTSATLFKSVRINGNYILPPNSPLRGFYITDASGQEYSTRNAPSNIEITENGPDTVLLTIKGSFKNSGTPFMDYILRMRFFAGSSRVDMSIVYDNSGVRNPALSGNHKRFRSSLFKTDIGVSGTKSLAMSEFYTDPAYTTQNYILLQDATPSKRDFAVPPPAGFLNSDPTDNQLDNFYLKIRKDGSLVYNQGGSPLSDPSGNNLAQGWPGARSQGGLFRVADSSNSFLMVSQDFWEKSPHTYAITGGNMFEAGFFPVNNPPYNDLTHAQGPVHFINPNNPAEYDQYGEFANVPYAPDYQNYNLLEGKAAIFRFGMNFDSSLGTTPQNYAKGSQTPLFALPPGWYYGPYGQGGQLSADVMGPLYIEARTWSNEPGLSAIQQTVATQMDNWGKSMYDQGALCTGASQSCITLIERRNRGSAFTGFGKRHYGWNVYGEFDWEGGDPDSNAYSLLEGGRLTAMRTQDPRGITDVESDHWTIHDTWRGNNVNTGSVYPPRVYQKGDWELGLPPSQRHSMYTGDALNALLTNDRDSIDSVIYSGWKPAGGFPVRSLNTVLTSIQPWKDYTMYYSDGIAHRGKALSNLVYLYRLTGRYEYITIAKQYLFYTKIYLDACKARFGIPWPAETTYANIPQGGGSESQCVLQYGGDTYGGNQLFMFGYFTRGLVETLEAEKEATGSYDPVLYPWAIDLLNFAHTYLIAPYVPPPGGTFDPPNTLVIYKGTVSAQTASTICGSFSQNVLRQILPLSGGTEPAQLIVCGFPYNGAGNAVYLYMGLAWLYHQNGDSQLLSNLLETARYVMLSFASQVSWRTSGSADIKVQAPFTHDLVPLYAAALYPLASQCSPVGATGPCSVPGQQGICVNGQRTCTSGPNGNAWSSCTQTVSPTTEICNNRDDDCDGIVDEGCDCFQWFSGNVCQSGQTCSTGTYYTQAQQANCCTGSCQTMVIPSGLIAAYRFEEVSGTIASDSSGNANQGTLMNGPQWTAGKYGGGVSLDGVDDYIMVSNSPSLNPSSAITITAWIKDPSAGGMIVAKGPDAGQYQLRHISGIRFVINGGTGPTASLQLSSSTWHHVAGSYDGSQMIVYVDGSPVGSPLSTTATIQPTANELDIGRRSPGQFAAINYLGGVIDEVRIYNRGLSQAEITSDMSLPLQQVSSPAPNAPTALVATATSPTSVSLSWSDNSNNEQNFVLEKQTGTGSFTIIAPNLPANTVAYTDATVSPGTAYTYRVKAVNGAGSSAYATSSPVTTPQSVPLAPTGLVVTSTSPTSVSLSWMDNANNELNFAVQRRLAGTVAFNTIATAPANPGIGTASFTDGTVSPATSYEYRVYANNAAGISGYSNIVPAQTPGLNCASPGPSCSQVGACQGTQPSCSQQQWVCNYVANNLAYQTIETSCSDTIDNDCDGENDCMDSDCYSQAVCAPAITGISPSTIFYNLANTIDVTGTGFVQGVTIFYANGIDFSSAASIISPTLLRLTLLAGNIPIGTYLLSVSNPPNPPPAAQATLIVSSPSPSITQLSPTTIFNNVSTTIQILGNNFLPASSPNPGSVVTFSFDGTNFLPLAFPINVLSSQAITVQLPSGIPPRTYYIRVENPGGIVSNRVAVDVQSPPGQLPGATLISLTPGVVINLMENNVTVIGAGFVQGSVASIDLVQYPQQTEFIDATRLKLTIPAYFSIGTHLIGVVNPGSIPSVNTLQLEVQEVAPVLGQISPSSFQLGVEGTATVTGENFYPTTNMVLDATGTVFGMSSFVSPSEIMLTIPSILGTGNYVLRARNPGGALSEEIATVIINQSGDIGQGLLPQNGTQAGITCTNGETRPCGPSVGICEQGVQICGNSEWGICQGGKGPNVKEVCGDNLDNDCDGETDELCTLSLQCSNGVQDANEEGVDCGVVCGRDCQSLLSGSEIEMLVLYSVVIILSLLGILYFYSRG